MGKMIQFVRNYDDLSTDKGFQFKFHCDKCGNGHMSHFETNALGMAGSLLNAAGSLFGGIFGQVGDATYQMQRAVGGRAHDEALDKAVQEGKQYFKQCSRCGKWVCPDVCWNHSAGLCEECAPDEKEELAAQQAKATSEQIYQKTREQNYTEHINFKEKTAVMQCTSCNTKLTSADKFCPGCGAPNSLARPQAENQSRFCSECGAPTQPGQKFCAGCGNKLF
ncbi:zinc ribbon domain-containing protein [Xanthocytophaga flava]|nr:zinc ribbon domain-containing protein [Xanthocytophaga flavus]MDJ1470630.1 zinc ribbon domain-containing protein [Xanthocytophaga flavus]